MSRFSVLESYHIHYGTANTTLYWVPKYQCSKYVGTLKGRTTIRVFNKFRHLKHKP